MKALVDKYLHDAAMGKILAFVAGLVVVWAIVQLIKRKLVPKIHENSTRYKTQKTVSFLGYFLVLLLFVVIYSEKLGGLTVAFGIAGAGIAFALQEVIASFAGWMAILFGGFYKPGDRVQLGGIKGDVMDIGVLRTTVMETGQWVNGDLYNGRIVLIANSFVFKEPVFNYSGEFPFLWDEIKVPIAFGSDYEMAKKILLDTGRHFAGDLTSMSREKWSGLQNMYRLEDAQTEPMVSLSVNDNWVEFTMRYVVDYKRRRSTKTDLFTRILKEVEGSNGVVKFASSTFEIVSVPDLKVTTNT